jgi:signal transduction histidine kinase
MTVVLIYRLRMFHLTHQLDVRFQERLAERTRIAQELHDTLLQSFQGLILRFQIANETVLSDPLYAKDLLEQALNRADQALAESRKAIQGIRSLASGGRGVADSLDAMMNGLVEELCCGKTPPLNTSVVAEGQPRTVNSCVAEEVCRIAREALWNSLFHAQAQRVESEVAYSDRFLRLRFRDDGIGIDSEILKNRGREGHWGISGMYERAKNIHAGLSIWSRPGAGTEVELTIPAFIAYDAAPSRAWFGLSMRKEQAPSP